MSTPSAASTPAAQTPSAPVSASSSALASDHGSTKIAEAVVSKIAGLATREVNGVHDLGGGAARTFGAIRERIPGATTNASQGVSVEVGEKQAAIDLNIVVEYGVAIADLAKAVRRNVISALERMTGLQVVEVNISVDDVHLPSEDDGKNEVEAPKPSSTPRVS
ncbi:putative alkaline shock family protein YloU [Pseudonocardia sediminis]|uniref:Putative alkaline shock family protein YloU n=1 Tax=Pseudonocardia sediminis TaxID=1397368 RepID=A0A4Q7UTD7_PSEST|nr:Asp23/Gls24 family envelope stress response protein [Pseudonocardia sediminis]RZT84264.1 putative alkaline shock family protein YloU [Pseudonocardia sediminis]